MNKSKRMYSRSRRAYVPRRWPMIASIIVSDLTFAVLFRPTPLLNLIFSVVLAVVVSFGRMAIWRRQHPAISVQEHLNDLRKSAMWN